jgi:hypothetical protein
MVQKNMENKIDDYFRERLYDHSLPAPESSWQVIDNRLKQKNLRTWWTIGISLAASIALIISLSIGFYLGSRYQNKVVNKNIVNNKSSNESETVASAGTLKQTSNSNNLKNNEGNNNNNNKIFTPAILMSRMQPERVEEITSTKEYISENSGKSGHDVINYHVLQSRKILLTSRSNRYNLAYNQTMVDAMLGKSNNESNTNEPQVDYNWQLGGNAAPLYAYRNISENTTDFSTESYNEYEKALLAYAAGLTVNFEKKRWKFETGVYYTKMGQKVNDVYVYESPDRAILGDAIPKENINNTNIFYHKIEATKNTLSPLNNSNGILVSNVYGMSNLKESSPNYLEDTKTSSNIEQQFSYIEVPLIAHYKIIDKRIDMSLTGGLSANILIGNTVYLKENNDKTEIGETDKTEPLNYAGICGFAIEVPIAARWDFVFEPRFRYYLNSINKSENISTHPYSLGVHSGVTFRF